MPALSRPFASFQAEHVRGHAQAVGVRFVDDGAVEFRGEPLVLPAPVVHPDLHDVDLLRGELSHRRPRLFLGGDPVRNLASARLGSRDPPARRLRPCAVRHALVPHFEGRVSFVVPQTHHQ